MDAGTKATTRANVQEAKESAVPAADIKEYPHSYVLFIDMPGLNYLDIKVEVDDKVLAISCEWKKDEERAGILTYLTKETKVGKFMRKFVLPENANSDDISAVLRSGVLAVTVKKLPPPPPKKRTIVVNW